MSENKEIKLVNGEIDCINFADDFYEDEGTCECEGCGNYYWSTAELPGGCNYKMGNLDIWTEYGGFCSGECFLKDMIENVTEDYWDESLDYNIESAFFQMPLDEQEKTILEFKKVIGDSDIVKIMEDKYKMFLNKYGKNK